MIEIREDEHSRLYRFCESLYGFYALIYEVKTGDQKTHWNLCYLIVALLMSPLYWALKQVRSMLTLCLLSCMELYFAIKDSEGSIKSFGVDFAGSIKDIIDDSGDSYGDPIHPGKAITYLWTIASIGSLGYLCYQYPKLMLVSTAVLIGTILLVGISDTINKVLAKTQQTIDDYHAEVSQRASRAYRKVCPCVKIVSAESQ